MNTQELKLLLELIVEPRGPFDPTAIEAFIKKWSSTSGHEAGHSQPFFTELFNLMGIFDPAKILFEATVKVEGEPGAKKMDVYCPQTFVIEAKQGSDGSSERVGHGRRGTQGYQSAMALAFQQGLRYARSLPEGIPPVLMVVDIGHSFHLWTSFQGNFRGFEAQMVIELAELADPARYQLLYDVLTDPRRRDPQRAAARVTKAIAGKLGDLAKALELKGHPPNDIARFLMRCLFTMFAEDIGILPDKPFEQYLKERWLDQPERFVQELERLWITMDKGGYFGVAYMPQVNGALFKDAKALPLDKAQLELLYESARADWTQVEPSIFGTLLERALSERERHALGAHYTPRAYIERLVWPTLIAPLREQWQQVQAQIRALESQIIDAKVQEELVAQKPKYKAPKQPKSDKLLEQAQKLAQDFRTQLSQIRILDPACGSGNFLYVTFDMLKQLEQEVLVTLAELGAGQQTLGLHEFTITPAQFYGIEIKEWAQQIAELTLWIGALQWWFKLHPKAQPPEPILRDHRHIEYRDAVLSWSDKLARLDEQGQPVTIWDGESYKPGPTPGTLVPDESKRLQIVDYSEPKQARWPDVDYIIGNPPFIGAGEAMRKALGDGYVKALHQAWPKVPESSDFVMHWWHRAAELLSAKKIEGFGLITTNSISQTRNRRTVQEALKREKLHISYAVPDHPWVDSSDGAAVRIAMTVCHQGQGEGTLAKVLEEKRHDADDYAVELEEDKGLVHANLTLGVNTTVAQALESNKKLSSPGVKLHGKGFVIKPEQARALGLGTVPGAELHIRHYRKGRDLTQKLRGVMVIDLYGLTSDEVAERFPAIFHHVHEKVKPKRDAKRDVNKSDSVAYADQWWLFGKPRPVMRSFLKGLSRYTATSETSTHRLFQFLDESILPDNMVVAIGLDDAFYLGVLSSRVHVVWALAQGGTLEDRPRYNKTRCFDTFPFPEVDEALRQAITQAAEALDAHRKQVIAKHPKLTMTEMYNVLEKLRAGKPLLQDKKKDEVKTNTDALISSRLLPMHQELDELVAQAYGLDVEASDEEILQRLVDLNQERTQEEASGHVRWLRPELQCPEQAELIEEEPDSLDEGDDEEQEDEETEGRVKITWPKKLADQVRALRNAIKAYPGQSQAWHRERFAKLQEEELAALLEAMLETGVVFETSDGRWF